MLVKAFAWANHVPLSVAVLPAGLESQPVEEAPVYDWTIMALGIVLALLAELAF